MKVYEVWKGALGIHIRPRAFRNQACWRGRHRYQCLRLTRQSAADEVLPCPVTVQGDAALGQYDRKQNTRQVLEKWAAKNQAVSAYWLQSKLTAQENQTELAQAQTTEHKSHKGIVLGDVQTHTTIPPWEPTEKVRQKTYFRPIQEMLTISTINK